eukprot:175073_1
MYLDDEFDVTKNEKIAIKWFSRFNNRKPTKEEQENIKQFVKADKSGLTVCNFNVAINDDDCKDTEEDDKMFKMKMKKKSIVKKNNSTKYTLNFDGDNEKEDGDTKQATKWFKRFNNRNPTKDEQEKIKSFIKDDQDTITSVVDTIDVD